MSTKIYTGFRFKTSDLFEIHEAVACFRRTLGPVRRRKVAAVLAAYAVSIIDGHAVNGVVHKDVRGSSPLGFARKDMRRRQKETLADGYRDPEVDFDFEIAVMPSAGRVYGMVFTEQQDWLRIWADCPVVESYAYWNNSDRPKDLSDDDWEERSRVWDAVLRAHPAGSPGMVGFTAQCVDRFDFPDELEVAAAIEPFEERVRSRAKANVMNALMLDEIGPEAVGAGPRCPSDYMWAFTKADRRVKDTEEGRLMLEKERSRLEQLLSREITVDDLTRRLT